MSYNYVQRLSGQKIEQELAVTFPKPITSSQSPVRFDDVPRRWISNRSKKLFLIAIALLLTRCFGLANADELTFVRNGETKTIVGEILVEAENGDILFQTRSGRLRIVQADEINEKVDNDEPFEPLSQKEVGAQLLNELPEGFKIHTTRHFVIAYNTERNYAKWVGGLYERLFKGFIGHWDKKRDFELNTKLKFPLVAIVFRTRAEYARYTQADTGQPPGNAIAYYNLLTNRVAMFDLTSELLPAGAAPEQNRNISQILAAPNSLDMVATVIHEATHQLMFNTGMQQRMSDTPLWINEGLAMFFETPDIHNNSGWRAIGQVSVPRLTEFRRGLASRPADAFESMLSVDERLQNPETAAFAYAEAWCFNYFLLNRHSKQYVAYLKHMSQKEPLDYDEPEDRLNEFKQFLGEDLAALEREFLDYIGNVRTN